MIVTPYDELGAFAPAGITEGGTWTFISGPETGPTVVGWGGSIDFTTYDFGTYIYEYEVTSGTCSYTAQLEIDWVDPPVPPNDDCANASNLPINGRFGFASLVAIEMREICPTSAGATFSGVGEPWPSISAPDLWFTANMTELGGSDLTIVTSVTGVPYGSDGILNPRLAIYDGCGGSLLAFAPASFGTRTNSLTITISAPTTLYVRVASDTPGIFDITMDA